ncbi:hypothetical protein HBI66_041470 [Parastagonospora nodorum]|nr:hypothetical protein HBH72_102910 [Parastagonospora nodorum]KAH5371334.1 hypothetical protein HBI48_038120 [Parastagonospora nodorum]KAH5605808.1 hypothetical protein HBI45_105230 [Parastagonospora nodorum]KAH6086953.1 hypothetical protein HBI66_041470 [Parastagonospora nodorum]KAH6129733.1 hypothetical protein HBI69_011880 [Parastagonospora nodorum]
MTRMGVPLFALVPARDLEALDPSRALESRSLPGRPPTSGFLDIRRLLGPLADSRACFGLPLVACVCRPSSASFNALLAAFAARALANASLIPGRSGLSTFPPVLAVMESLNDGARFILPFLGCLTTCFTATILPLGCLKFLVISSG